MRYNFSEWSGIWTDLAIEQMLMRPIKSSGGLKGGRFRNKENARRLWCNTLDHLLEINEVMGDIIKSRSSSHKLPPHIDASNRTGEHNSA